MCKSKLLFMQSGKHIENRKENETYTNNESFLTYKSPVPCFTKVQTRLLEVVLLQISCQAFMLSSNENKWDEITGFDCFLGLKLSVSWFMGVHFYFCSIFVFGSFCISSERGGGNNVASFRWKIICYE